MPVLCKRRCEVKTTATQFLDFDSAMRELDALKLAVSSLATLVPRGSHERENAENSALGIRARIDYLHDSFSVLLEGAK